MRLYSKFFGGTKHNGNIGMVAYACNSSSMKAKTGEFLYLKVVWTGYIVQGSAELHNKTLFEKRKITMEECEVWQRLRWNQVVVRVSTVQIKDRNQFAVCVCPTRSGEGGHK